MLAAGQLPPPEFSRAEVAELLIEPTGPDHPPTKGTAPHDQRHRLRALAHRPVRRWQVDRGLQARPGPGRAGHRVELLDGDEVRTNLCQGLGFSREDRDTNIARIGYVAGKLSKHGVAVLVAAISPYREARDLVGAQVDSFVEVYVAAPLSTCAERDVKGLYAKALAGEIKNFTGVSDPYEPPPTPRSSCTPRPRAWTTRSTR